MSWELYAAVASFLVPAIIWGIDRLSLDIPRPVLLSITVGCAISLVVFLGLAIRHPDAEDHAGDASKSVGGTPVNSSGTGRNGQPAPADDAGEAMAADDAAKDVVEKFYAALQAGDNTAAAALVVPQMRPATPIRSDFLFYGTSPRPNLELGFVRWIRPATFLAGYHYYPPKKLCGESAIVTTVHRDAEILIDSIKIHSHDCE